MPDQGAALLLALLASAAFGVFGNCTRRGMAHVDAQTGSLVSIAAVALLFSSSAPLWMRAEYWLTPGFWVFFGNGFLHPTLSMYCAYEATRLAGATVAGTLSATTPLWATALAVVWLGESLSVTGGLGTLLTAAGVVVLSVSGGRVPRLMLGALLFATGAAVVRAVNHNLGRYGLELLPAPMMAGWVSFTVAFVLSTAAFRLVKGRLPVRLPAAGVAWCAAGGACGAVAIAAMYAALGLGGVVLVTPIVSAAPVFTLLVALAFREEALGARVVAGVLVTIAGVVLVALG